MRDITQKIIVITIVVIIGISIMHFLSTPSQYDEHTWNDAYKGGYIAGISGLPKEIIIPKYQENYDRGYEDGLRINQSQGAEREA